MATRRYNFRLYPNKEQEKKLFLARRLHCYLYNACIAHRRYEWRKNQKSVDYFEQQNCLPEFKKQWVEFAELNSQTLQGTVKRVDLAYNSFFQGLRKLPKFKSIRQYSGWTYPGKSGYKVETLGKHGRLILRDLGITLRMRGQAKQWGQVSTVTVETPSPCVGVVHLIEIHWAGWTLSRRIGNHSIKQSASFSFLFKRFRGAKCFPSSSWNNGG